MKKTRTSLRATSSCNQIHNIFHKTQGNSYILQKLPLKIINKIGSLNLISCATISQLPPFIHDPNWEIQLEGMRIATRYELNWQSTFTQSSHLQNQGFDEHQQSDPIIKYRSSNCMKEEEFQERQPINPMDIWEDPQFLQKLNNFIMGEHTETKNFPSTESLLQG